VDIIAEQVKTFERLLQKHEETGGRIYLREQAKSIAKEILISLKTKFPSLSEEKNFRDIMLDLSK
jgi:hypothetical protein